MADRYHKLYQKKQGAMPSVALLRTEYVSMLNPCVTMPLGIHQLAAVLNQHDIPVAGLLDAQIYRPPGLRQKFMEIVNRRPDVVGLSAVSNHQSFVKLAAQFFRKHLPDSIIVVGGPFASATPEGAVQIGAVDFAIAGEGEESFPALLKALVSGSDYRQISGLAYQDNGTIHVNPRKPLSISLDDLPTIDWDRVDFARYGRFLSMCFRRSPHGVIMASRGCPFNCIYCHRIFGNRFRVRSTEHVLAELHLLYDKYGIRRFEFIDDNFAWDIERAKEILTRMRDELPGVSVGFGNGLRADHVDEPLMKLLGEVRTHFLPIPVESASPRIQKLIRKNLNLESAVETTRLARKYKIPTWGFFMVGFPTETVEEMKQTIEFADRLDVDFISIQAANPFEGTKLREMLGDQSTSEELGNVHKDFTAGGQAMESLNSMKLKVMRSKLKKPANWRFLWNIATWKLWWLGPGQVLSQALNLLREYLTQNKVYTVDGLEQERSTISNRIKSALR